MASRRRIEPDQLLDQVVQAEIHTRKLVQSATKLPKRSLLEAVRIRVSHLFEEDDDQQAEIEAFSLLRVLEVMRGWEPALLALELLGCESEGVVERARSVLMAKDLLSPKDLQKAIAKASELLPPEHPCMVQIPMIIAQLQGDKRLALLRPFLQSKEEEVVLAAVQALMDGGFENAARELEPLLDDQRPVEIDIGETGHAELLPLGLIVRQAHDLLVRTDQVVQRVREE